MNKYFKYHFDVISCHFAFHYFLATEDRFEQTLKNIELLLNHGGYIILTLFDGQLVNEYIEKEGKDGVVENYIDVNGIKIRVTNLLGTAFMKEEVISPYQSLKQLLDDTIGENSIHIVDFHAEATGEKMCIGYCFDGLVSAVLGTHTHVQTNDNK